MSIGGVSTDLQKILRPEESKKDSQIATLENDLQCLKDSHNTERFAIVIVLMILLDMIAFPHVSWPLGVFIGFLEIILIFVFAELLGFDRIYTVLTNAADIVAKLKKGGS